MQVKPLCDVIIRHSYISMNYYHINSYENYIYILGGLHNNQRYSVEENLWKPFYENDTQTSRDTCASDIFLKFKKIFANNDNNNFKVINISN
ncbi:hypothetical protein PPL_03850 [Heterostelium album PN500]|uniref:Uncharacterized protein n=1 Tax=Heterostelium pallidum (strain ATCC 26659 / Pp 5 / PN500) TaxID=670386 RepID=D3B6U2_HETP5|nr:hypothetical protein PPL_03850 [Heterostelium album PN500]EFA83062.1 hypothetical protein PPL_03850 [Heterostelium album PN500]|eukprot:XP_020435179.1 hypothetical protein PPL_03850 [Heterostelium album PN500]